MVGQKSKQRSLLHPACVTAISWYLSSSVGAARPLEHHPRKSLASFSFAELQIFSQEMQDRWHRALRAEGALLLTNIPGYSEATATALDEVSSCFETAKDLVADHTNASQGPLESFLPGGVHRLTLATSTAKRVQQPLPAWTKAHCPQAIKPTATLRGLTAMLIDHIAQSVDAVSERNNESRASQPPDFGNMVRNGLHLEHFHRYVQLEGTAEQPTLSMHTDVGLLQVLAVHWRVAARSAKAVGTRGGLEVELSDGTIVPAEFPTESGSVASHGGGMLVLVGQGFTEWLPHAGLRAAPHSLAITSTGQERLVYGVMVLPPKDWVLPGAGDVTFGEWWENAQRAFNGNGDTPSHFGATSMMSSSGTGCLSTGELHRRLEDQADACSAGEIYCWMQCAPASHLPCGAEYAICVSGQKGEICSSGEGHVHDASCRPRCPADNFFNLEVVGAGENTIVNGIYKPDEAYNEKRSFRKPRSPIDNDVQVPPVWIYWHKTRSQWLLYAEEYKENAVLYYNDIDSASPPEDGWQTSEGDPPEPRVRYLKSSSNSGPFGTTYAGEGFCNGLLTDMHMTGFVSRGEEHPCLILLFPGWELTEESKFWAAFAGVIAAGVFAEFLIAFRRQVGPPKRALWSKQASDGRRLQPKGVVDRLWRLCLYAASRALGYFVMLVSMTYSVELFFAVLIGLTLGHAIFNIQVAAGEDMTACCQAQANSKKVAIRPKPPGEDLLAAGATLTVSGMTCNACVDTVRRAVESIDEVDKVVELSLSSGRVVVNFQKPPKLPAQELVEKVCEAVEDVGFGVDAISYHGSPTNARE